MHHCVSILGLWSLMGCVEIEPSQGPFGWSSGTGEPPDTTMSDASDFDEQPGDMPARLDVSAGGAPAGQACTGVSSETYAHIWIANSPQGTVSKIDTRTGAEQGRYYTGPSMGIDNPSRTSVGLAGDVVVANRLGSVVSVAADRERCIDRNGNGVIETSGGATDVLRWGEDECVRWNSFLSTDADSTHGPRPVGWDIGEGDDPCDVSDDRVWVGWFDHHTNTGRFERRDGTDGALLDEVSVEEWDASRSSNFGPYGGAVDGDGNFWVLGLFGPIVKIDGQTLEVSRWEVPSGTSPYGLALDEDGHPWLAGYDGNVLHLDPELGWSEPILVGDGRRLRGLQVDQEGQAWIAANDPCGVVMVDTKTSALIYSQIELQDCREPVGVSVDIDGQVWLPDFGGNSVYRLDPDELSTVRTVGLQGPYTYSDMTGAGLRLVAHQPVG